MKESKFFEDLVQHPLYQAAERCIDAGITDNYNYLDFFSNGNGLLLDYKQIIQELFKVDGNDFEAFIVSGGPKSKYNGLIYYLESLSDEGASKKLLRFLLALPMLEYNIELSLEHYSDRPVLRSVFDKMHSNFVYDSDIFSEICDNEIYDTIETIVASSTSAGLATGLQDFAFHRYKLLDHKIDVNLNFRDVLKSYLIEPTCWLLNSTFGLNAEVKYDLRTKSDLDFKVSSDLLVVRDYGVFCPIKVESCRLFVDSNSEGTGIDMLSSNKTQALMRQLIIQMIYHKTNMGVLTNTYDVVFVEIDLGYFENHGDKFTATSGPKTIPLRYKILNCRSATPTLREALTHFLFKAIVDDNTLKIRQERMSFFRKYVRATCEEYKKECMDVSDLERTNSRRRSKETRHKTKKSRRKSKRVLFASINLHPIGEDDEALRGDEIAKKGVIEEEDEAQKDETMKEDSAKNEEAEKESETEKADKIGKIRKQ